MKNTTHLTVATVRKGEPAPATPPAAPKPGALKTTPDVRHENFLSLFERFKLEIWRAWPNEPEKGMMRRFADRLTLSERYVSHLKNRRREIGNATARKLEVALSLPVGWMDQNHDRDQGGQSAPADTPLGEIAAGMIPGELQFIEMASAVFRDSPEEAQKAIVELLLKKMKNKTPV